MIGDLIDTLVNGLQALGDSIVGAFEWLYAMLLALYEAALNHVAVWTQQLFDWFKTNIQMVWDWVVVLIDQIWDKFVEWFLITWPWLRDGLIEWAKQFKDWLQGQLDSFGVSVDLDGIITAFGTVAEYYADAAWLLPLNGVAAIIAGTFVTSAVIRLVRWIYSALWISG